MVDWAHAGVGMCRNGDHHIADGVWRVYVNRSWACVSWVCRRRSGRQSFRVGKHTAIHGVARPFDGSGALTNRTWADAAVEIFTAVLATIGPIGLGVALIIGTIGAALWLADRRGWMRPTSDPAPLPECKAADLDRLDRVIAAIEYNLGSNNAKHDVTHDMIRELRRDILG